MTNVIERFMSRWPRYVQTATNGLLMAGSILVIHRVLFTAFLETPNGEATLIRLDLLQAIAFLVALSALLITITRLVVNKARDTELLNREVSWKADAIESQIQQHAQNHPDYTEDVRRLELQMEEIMQRLGTSLEKIVSLMEENERLKSENEQIKQQINGLNETE